MQSSVHTACNVKHRYKPISSGNVQVRAFGTVGAYVLSLKISWLHHIMCWTKNSWSHVHV